MSQVPGHITVAGPCSGLRRLTSVKGFFCLVSVQSEKALYACVAGPSLGPPGNVNATANSSERLVGEWSTHALPRRDLGPRQNLYSFKLENLYTQFQFEKQCKRQNCPCTHDGSL